MFLGAVAVGTTMAALIALVVRWGGAGSLRGAGPGAAIRARRTAAGLLVAAVVAGPACFSLQVLDAARDGSGGDASVGLGTGAFAVDGRSPARVFALARSGAGPTAVPSSTFRLSAPDVWGGHTRLPTAEAQLVADARRAGGGRDGAPLFLSDSWRVSAAVIDATGREVLTDGGFSGQVPVFTTARIESMVHSGQERLFVVTANAPRPTGPAGDDHPRVLGRTVVGRTVGPLVVGVRRRPGLLAGTLRLTCSQVPAAARLRRTCYCPGRGKNPVLLAGRKRTRGLIGVATSSSKEYSVSAPPSRLRDAWIALAGLSAVFLFEMLDNSVLNVALPTIGHDLDASTAALQWVSGAYSVTFGGLMLLFGAVADRFGRRRTMLVGLVLLAIASVLTLGVTSVGELIAVRALMGVAAAMTTPGSMALAFRLFDTDDLRVRALTVVSTAGLVGLAVAPTLGGFVLAVAPWQVLVVANAPIAVVAFVGIATGIDADRREDLHQHPVDVLGAVLGTLCVVGVLGTPTLFVAGVPVGVAWAAAVVSVLAAAGFLIRERTARHPLLDLGLLLRPLVASGLAYKAAAGLATAGLSFLVTLQLQSAWGWSPALAAVGTLPQVAVLLVGGRFVGPFVRRVGLGRAAWTSAAAVVGGLVVFAALGRYGYPFVAVALVLVAAGMRVVGAVAGTNVLTGLPADRVSIGAALVDTASEVATAVGIAASGTVLAALVAGSVAAGARTPAEASSLSSGLAVAGAAVAVVAALLVAVGVVRSRSTEPTNPSVTPVQEPADV